MSELIGETRALIQQGIDQALEVGPPSIAAHEGMNEGSEHIRLAVDGIAAVLGHLDRAKEAYGRSATACRESVSAMRDSKDSFVSAGANEDEAMARVVKALENSQNSTQLVKKGLDGLNTYLDESSRMLEDRQETLEDILTKLKVNITFIDGNARNLAPVVTAEAQKWQSRI